MQHLRAAVGKLAQLAVGRALDGARMIDDAGIGHQDAGDIRPVFIDIRIQRRRGGQVALQVSGGVQLLDTDDILYLETRDRLLHYHTATDTWSVRGSLLKAEKDLAAYHFARCNQCYLVNLRHVRGVQDDLVQVGEERLEISRRQRTAFLAALAAYVGGAL